MPLLLPSSSSSTSLLGSCTVDGVFDHAAPDRVMHIKVNGSFGACICVDEHVVQLNRISEYLTLYQGGLAYLIAALPFTIGGMKNE